MPILPVLIDCNPSTLTRREKWYQIPHRRFHLRMRVLTPVSAGQWVGAQELQSLAGRKLTQALENHFTQELERHGRN
jgi:hypothetical protein